MEERLRDKLGMESICSLLLRFRNLKDSNKGFLQIVYLRKYIAFLIIPDLIIIQIKILKNRAVFREAQLARSPSSLIFLLY